jgi:hypothetical protein
MDLGSVLAGLRFPHPGPGRAVHRGVRCSARGCGHRGSDDPAAQPQANALADRWVAVIVQAVLAASGSAGLGSL